jgi:meso-butanediol dehydrogenase/(S,S)-butanediol dehydrogenase/diacetyl reductase
MKLAGRVAIVTGAGRGVGRGIALELARNGANVVVADLNLDTAEAVADEINTLERDSLPLLVDVTVQSQMETMVAQAVTDLGRLDIMVNNAGVGHVKPFLEITEDEWDMVFAVNLKGMLFGMQAAAKAMIYQERCGRIVNISSVAGKSGRPLLASYAASKSAVINLTQSAAMALAPHKITVNAICPGVVDTHMGKSVIAKMQAYVDEGKIPEELIRIPEAPLGPRAEPEDIAKMAAFLASDDADYITGQSINVDGGRCTH